MSRLLSVLLLMLISLTSYADTIAPAPSRVHAVYVVSKGGIGLAEIDEVYTASAGHYSLVSIARPLGLFAVFRPGKIYIYSEGEIASSGLKPLSFSYRQDGSANKDSAAKFLWSEHKLNLSRTGIKTQLDMPDDSQDRLSAMYQFMFLDLKVASSLDFHMTNGSKLDIYHYAITAGRPFNSAAGSFETLYLDSQAKPGETRTQVWLAKSRHHIPCKVVITDPEGGQLTQELRKLEVQP